MRYITHCHFEDIASLCWEYITKVAIFISSAYQPVKISVIDSNFHWDESGGCFGRISLCSNQIMYLMGSHD